MNTRYIVLDTETTGLDVNDNHKIIEIGCIEILNRSITDYTFHHYINPCRSIDASAIAVHGITNEKLKNEPIFSDIKDKFISYVNGSEVIAHNAPFDIGFLEKEFNDCGININQINLFSKVHDTLAMARGIYPGKRNSLDALCNRLNVDNSFRNLHGALLDARLLAQVYLKMTMGQTSMTHLLNNDGTQQKINNLSQPSKIHRQKIIRASKDEIDLHKSYFSK